MADRLQQIFLRLLPLIWVAGGFLIGLVLERLIRARARRAAGEADRLALAALHGMAVIWFSVAGFYGALLAMPPSLSFLLIPLERILLSIAIVSATIAAGRAAAGLVRFYAERRANLLGSTSIFVNLARALVLVIGALVLLQSLGISITPILTALGVGGLAVALALQDTLSNLFSGLHVAASQQIRPGDYIRLDSGDEGFVTDITWRNTTIRALPNNLIVVPNVKLASAIITNYSRPDKELTVSIPVKVGYGNDLGLVEEITLEAAKEVVRSTPGAVLGFEPLVRYGSFGDLGIGLSVVLRVRELSDQYLLKHELLKRLHARYREAGVGFAVIRLGGDPEEEKRSRGEEEFGG